MRANVYASFTNTDMAKDAVGALLDHGVLSEDITLVVPVPPGQETAEGADRAEAAIDQAKGGITTTTSADAAVGATKGAFVGLGIGALAVLASIFIPGVGLVVGGGAIATALAGAAGAAVAGSVAGGVAGYLKDQGVPADEVTRFTNVYEGGGAVLVVTAPSGGNGIELVESIIGKYDAANTRIWRPDPHEVVVDTTIPAVPRFIEPTVVAVDPPVTMNEQPIVQVVNPAVAAVSPPPIYVEPGAVIVEPNPVIVEPAAVVVPVAQTEPPEFVDRAVVIEQLADAPAPVIDQSPTVEPGMAVKRASSDDPATVVEPSVRGS